MTNDTRKSRKSENFTGPIFTETILEDHHAESCPCSITAWGYTQSSPQLWPSLNSCTSQRLARRQRIAKILRCPKKNYEYFGRDSSTQEVARCAKEETITCRYIAIVGENSVDLPWSINEFSIHLTRRPGRVRKYLKYSGNSDAFSEWVDGPESIKTRVFYSAVSNHELVCDCYADFCAVSFFRR